MIGYVAFGRRETSLPEMNDPYLWVPSNSEMFRRLRNSDWPMLASFESRRSDAVKSTVPDRTCSPQS